jgi:hypothetical protein
MRDELELVLVNLLAARGLHLRIDGVEERTGRPHVKVYGGARGYTLLGAFYSSIDALRWLEHEGAEYAQD